MLISYQHNNYQQAILTTIKQKNLLTKNTIGEASKKMLKPILNIVRFCLALKVVWHKLYSNF